MCIGGDSEVSQAMHACTCVASQFRASRVAPDVSSCPLGVTVLGFSQLTRYNSNQVPCWVCPLQLLCVHLAVFPRENFHCLITLTGLASHEIAVSGIICKRCNNHELHRVLCSLLDIVLFYLQCTILHPSSRLSQARTAPSF